MMKGIFSLLLILCGLSFIPAQNTLQFNQSKLITTSEETVPSGKVWKVVGIFTDQTSFGNHSTTNTPAILVNGVKNYYVVPYPIGSGTFCIAPTGFPFWLPAGTTLAASNKTRFVNVIEFNVIN